MLHFTKIELYLLKEALLSHSSLLHKHKGEVLDKANVTMKRHPTEADKQEVLNNPQLPLLRELSAALERCQLAQAKISKELRRRGKARTKRKSE